MATGFAVLLVACTWLGIRVYRLQTQITQQAATSEQDQHLLQDLQRERTQRERAEQELNNYKAAAAIAGQASQALPFVAVTLLPGAVRDAQGMQRLMLPAGKEAANLQLALETDEYPSYDATLQTPEGNPVWIAKGLQAGKTSVGTVISVRLSRDVLKPQDYLLRINGVRNGAAEPVSAYYFRVTASAQ